RCQARRSFFFSSRRRHTRFSRDWSSDVCSSDLKFRNHEQWRKSTLEEAKPLPDADDNITDTYAMRYVRADMFALEYRYNEQTTRSEERRVGKESSARRWRDRRKKKQGRQEARPA